MKKSSFFIFSLLVMVILLLLFKISFDGVFSETQVLNKKIEYLKNEKKSLRMKMVYKDHLIIEKDYLLKNQSRFPASVEMRESLYQNKVIKRIVGLFLNKEYEKVIYEVNNYKTHFSSSEALPQAILLSAESGKHLGQLDHSLKEISFLIDNYPTHHETAVGLLLMSKILMESQREAEAKEALKIIINYFSHEKEIYEKAVAELNLKPRDS